MSADSNGLEAHGFVAHHLAMLGERQISAKECCVNMAIDGWYLWMSVEHGVECLHVVNSPLEGGAHGIDYEHGATCIKRFLKFLRYHAPHGVALDKPHVEILQVSQTHV